MDDKELKLMMSPFSFPIYEYIYKNVINSIKACAYLKMSHRYNGG